MTHGKKCFSGRTTNVTCFILYVLCCFPVFFFFFSLYSLLLLYIFIYFLLLCASSLACFMGKKDIKRDIALALLLSLWLLLLSLNGDRGEKRLRWRVHIILRVCVCVCPGEITIYVERTTGKKKMRKTEGIDVTLERSSSSSLCIYI